jgi:hypothetical protein
LEIYWFQLVQRTTLPLENKYWILRAAAVPAVTTLFRRQTPFMGCSDRAAYGKSNLEMTRSPVVWRIAAVRRLPLRFVLLATLGWLTPVAVADDNECFSDWSIAAALVQSEKLVTVDKLISGAKTSIPGEIIKTTLCKEDGRFVFRLVVRHKGTLKTVTVDAREPFPN